MPKIRWETAPQNSPDSSVVLGYINRPEDGKSIVRYVLTRSQMDWRWMSIDTKTNLFSRFGFKNMADAAEAMQYDYDDENKQLT